MWKSEKVSFPELTKVFQQFPLLYGRFGMLPMRDIFSPVSLRLSMASLQRKSIRSHTPLKSACIASRRGGERGLASKGYDPYAKGSEYPEAFGKYGIPLKAEDKGAKSLDPTLSWLRTRTREQASR